MYRAAGFAHATAHHQLQKAHRALATHEEGQGTVEYIGLILLIAAVMVAVVAAKGDGKDLATTIVGKVKESIETVGKAK
jgi:Flp pilus assembly pilin Flp